MAQRRHRRRSDERGTSRFSYSRWDGTQVGFEMDAEGLLERVTDDLLYHGDINAALRRLLQGGFDDDSGQRVEGIRDLLDRLREAREERLEQGDLGGVYDEIAQELSEIVADEQQALSDLAERAAAADDERRREVVEQAAVENQMRLELLPNDLAGKMKSLTDYDFTSDDAAQRFDDLVERLREQLAQSWFDQMSGSMEGMSPEDMTRTKDMMAELNQMLEQRERGEEPDFEGFMERYGDFFPENPQTLDELLEIMAQRMAAMQAMLNSMTPEQRAQLQQLAEQLLDDMDLAFEADRLGQNLRQAFPQMGWDNSFDLSGSDPLDLAAAAKLFEELGELDQLEQMLRGVTQPGALAEVDTERVRELLGADAAQSVDRLSELAQMLEDAGMVENKEGQLELTPRAIRRLGQQALSELFEGLSLDRLGGHEQARSGIGHERNFQTKPYEFGDPFNLQIERTLRNAVRRRAAEGADSTGPIGLHPDDFEIVRTEQVVRSSTVLLLDLSMSMPIRDNFLPAKKVAMALHSLISSQFPRDFLGVVGFGELAREIDPRELPEVSWDLNYGTNMQHAFMLARRMLARETGTKQIIMITDGEPTAHLNAAGAPEFHYPPIRETVDATLLEVGRLTREGVRINTFMLDPNGYLRAFIEKLTEMNRGRAFFTTPETLGDYVLVDFLDHKRSLITGR
mgnify:CR=1 FL=1